MNTVSICPSVCLSVCPSVRLAEYAKDVAVQQAWGMPGALGDAPPSPPAGGRRVSQGLTCMRACICTMLLLLLLPGWQPMPDCILPTVGKERGRLVRACFICGLTSDQQQHRGWGGWERMELISSGLYV